MKNLIYVLMLWAITIPISAENDNGNANTKINYNIENNLMVSIQLRSSID